MSCVMCKGKTFIKVMGIDYCIHCGEPINTIEVDEAKTRRALENTNALYDERKAARLAFDFEHEAQTRRNEEM